MNVININENGISIIFEIVKDGPVRLINFSSNTIDLEKLPEEKIRYKWVAVEVNLTGENHNDHHANKYTGTSLGSKLCYASHNDTRNEFGRKIEIIQRHDDIYVSSIYQLFDGLPIVQCYSQINNLSNNEIILEYISSFASYGRMRDDLGGNWDEKAIIYVPHNTWHGEFQWRKHNIRDLGLSKVNDFCLKRFSLSNSNSWSSGEYLPMGILENSEDASSLFWQIEHNGSWYYEIGDMRKDLYVQIGGPNANQSHFWKKLGKGDSFKSVPVAVGSVIGNFEEVAGVLTKYRRTIRRKNTDNYKLPVIFNDYMNCLWAEPSTQLELPIIEKAALIGAEYYCIDAGWYDDGYWWDSVGEWEESKGRFPNGLIEVIDKIRQNGMVPGLWLELEVIGINSPLVSIISKDWFFTRFGKAVIDHGRYHLDYRNTDVRKYATEIIDRLIKCYGIGYIKMDYNISTGIGTELDCFSFGEGLLDHNRAYLTWIDSIFEKYPEIIIENCGSGGMRIDYAMLKSHSIQSVSDQTDYRKMSRIAASSALAVTMEQSAIWSYPLESSDQEATIFNMVNALTQRIHQSGKIECLNDECLGLVKEAIEYYKTMRDDIKDALPFWPIGFPKVEDKVYAFGIKSDKKAYLAVWRLNSDENETNITLKGRNIECVDLVYPNNSNVKYNYNSENENLAIYLKQNYSARFFELRQKE